MFRFEPMGLFLYIVSLPDNLCFYEVQQRGFSSHTCTCILYVFFYRLSDRVNSRLFPVVLNVFLEQLAQIFVVSI